MAKQSVIAIVTLAALAAAAPSLASASEPCPAAPPANLGEIRDGSFRSGDVPIHYLEAGRRDAPAMILIHGFMTDSRQNWGAAIPRLAENFHVIAMDARGHGKSGKPHDSGAYGSYLATDVLALMDHLRIEKAHVAGFSMGGLITLYLAAHHPDRLLSAIVGGFGLPAAPLPTEGGALDTALKEAISTGESLPEVLRRQNSQYAGMAAFRYEPILAFYDELQSVKTDAIALQFAHKSLPQLYVDAEEAAAISVPILAIAGDRDPSLQDIMALRKTHPATAIALIPFCGHLNASASPQFIEAMKKFAQNPDP